MGHGGRVPAGGGRTLELVPALEVPGRIAEAVARALEQHRAELAELVERQVDAELERLAGELVTESLARRNGEPNGSGEAVELKRCSTCGRLRPRSQYNRDRRTTDGLRARCRECRQCREYPREVATRRARRAREKPRPAAQAPASDDDDARPDPRPVKNGRAADNGSHGERVYSPTVDQWLVESGFATLEHGELVATAAGLDVGSALADSRVFA
jgi:hypothetical protein